VFLNVVIINNQMRIKMDSKKLQEKINNGELTIGDVQENPVVVWNYIIKKREIEFNHSEGSFFKATGLASQENEKEQFTDFYNKIEDAETKSELSEILVKEFQKARSMSPGLLGLVTNAFRQHIIDICSGRYNKGIQE
jgi:hypothetical protein